MGKILNPEVAVLKSQYVSSKMFRYAEKIKSCFFINRAHQESEMNASVNDAQNVAQSKRNIRTKKWELC